MTSGSILSTQTAVSDKNLVPPPGNDVLVEGIARKCFRRISMSQQQATNESFLCILIAFVEEITFLFAVLRRYRFSFEDKDEADR